MNPIRTILTNLSHFIRLNTFAVIFTVLFLAGCSNSDKNLPAPVHVDLDVDAERETADTDDPDSSMPYLWHTDDCLGIYVRHRIDGTQPTDNLRYTNSEEALSSTARFTTEAPFDICEGDLITGYSPYSTEPDIAANSTRSAEQGIVRPFTLGAQLQDGDNSTAHVEELDFMMATPVTVNEALLAGAPEAVVPMLFTHAFATIKFELRNEYRRAFRIQKITLESSDNTALTGDYAIDIVTHTITIPDPVPSVELTFKNNGRTAIDDRLTGYAVVSATTLAAGAVLTVSTSIGTFKTVTTTDILLERGHINTLAITLSADTFVGEETIASIDNCIGSWRLTLFCGIPADFDVYITMRSDGTFTLYQRSADYTPVSFSGNYTFDAKSCRLSGCYDDGTAWADSYIVEEADEEIMVWVNEMTHSEISVYTRSDIPASMLGDGTKTSYTNNASDRDIRFL